MNSISIRPGAAIVPAVLAIGLATGLMMRPTVDQLFFTTLQEGDDHEEQKSEQDINVHSDEDEDNHVALSQQAYQNLKLSVAPVELSNYKQTIRMPGEVIESPGLSVQNVASPVSGSITRLFASPGVSVTEGVPLFEVEIIDDEMMGTQLRLLELLTKQEIANSELSRITPLAAAGSVAGRKQLEWEYQMKEVDSSLARVRQELVMRGLTSEQINEIAKSKQTLSKLVAKTPRPAATEYQAAIRSEKLAQDELARVPWSQSLVDQCDLTVEKLLVEVGENVTRGEPICSLAAHGLLSVCGHAFENEVEVVSQLADQHHPVTVEFGIEGSSTFSDGLRIQYIDSHVDERTQTFRYFIPLPNEVVRESTDSLGRRFRTWRYKVGQRVHVHIPDREIHGHIVLPRDAVVQEGLDAFVFREHVEEEDESSLTTVDASEHEDVFIEFEPVPVTVVHRDRSVTVLAPSEELAVGDRVAMGSAYQLLLAMKTEQDGGGGHHHHDH